MTQLSSDFVSELNVDLPSNDRYSEDETTTKADKDRKSQSLFNKNSIDINRLIEVDQNIVDDPQVSKLNFRMARFTFDSVSSEKTFHQWSGYSVFLDTAENMMKFSHGNLAEITNRKDELTAKAMQGILKEGELVGKHWEAEQLVEHLNRIRHRSLDVIQACCVGLYTRDSFRYRILNRAMRSAAEENQTLVGKNKIDVYV